MTAPRPQRIRGDAVTPVEVEHGGVTSTIQRLVTRASTGSEVMLGVMRMPAGAVARWSLEAEDPGLPDVRFWGPIHEVYHVVEGELTVDAGAGVEPCGAGDAYYFAPGHRYVVACVEPAVIVYAITPPPM